MIDPNNKKFTWGTSIFFHLLLLSVLLVHFWASNSQPPSVIKATVLTEAQVQQAINAAKHHQEAEEKQAELQKQQKEAHAAKQLQEQKLAEQMQEVEAKKTQQEKPQKEALEKVKTEPQKKLPIEKTIPAPPEKTAPAKQKQIQEKLLKEKIVKEQNELKKAQENLLKQEMAKEQAKLKKAQENLLKEQMAKEAQELKKAQENALKQQMANEQTQLNAAREQQIQSIVDRYKSLIVNAIAQRWIVPENMGKDISCLLQIQVAPGGAVLNVSLVQSSGNPALDRSAIAAVYKASPLPVPDEAEVFSEFRQFNLKVRPESYLNT